MHKKPGKITNRVRLQKSADFRPVIPEAVIIQAGLVIISSAGEHIRISVIAGR